MGQRIGRYEIVRELGEGQFGTVWMAAGEVPGRAGQPGKRRTVAIKHLREDADAESLRLLVQEFALLEQVKHRSIVRVYEYLPTERAVVMEMVHGCPLRVVIDKCVEAREPIVTEAAIEIVCEIADALYQAYTSPGDNGERLQLVHRDLKPENIMLTPSGEVKILDFGLARVGNTEFAKEDPRWIKGTPIYMAPEQARGEEIDHRSDLFALGLILYELLMGQAAYRAPTGVRDPSAAMYQAIERGDLAEPIRELESKLPAVGTVIARLLNPRPRLRYQTGQDLLVDLRQIYRDRGAYLKQFCTFFFGTIHRLEPLPDSESGQGAKMSEQAPRKSIEERLKEKEAAAEAPAAPAPKTPVAVVRRPPSSPAAEAPAPPPAAPPVAPPAAPKMTAVPPRIVPRTASAARPAPPEDDIVPSVKGAAPPKKGGSGARSMDEPGMLPMHPLTAKDDEVESSVDPSATAFFAIPAPKATAPKPAPEEAPVPQAKAVQPSSPVGPPPSNIDRPAFPGGGGTIGMGQAAGSAGTPFNVAGPTPTGNANREKDVESSRIWVLIVGMFGLACMLVVGLALLIFLIPKQEPKPVEKVVEAKPVHEKADTGTVRPPDPTPTPQPIRKQTGGTPPATPKPPPPPPAPSDRVSISFSGSPVPSSLEIFCDNGFRQRNNINNNATSFAGVPNVGCKVIPKGGTVTTDAPVKAGRSYSCTIQGTTLNCK